MAIKTFTVSETLTASDTNTYLANAGLVYVTQVTVGSGVSSVNISNCFSSAYDNYLVTITGGTGSNTDHLLLQLSGATGSTYYTAGNYVQYTVATNNAYAPLAATTTRIGFTSPSGYSTSVTLMNPNLAKLTLMNIQAASFFGMAVYAGVETGTAQHTGFTISPNAGTLTGGAITVYGYRKG